MDVYATLQSSRNDYLKLGQSVVWPGANILNIGFEITTASILTHENTRG